MLSSELRRRYHDNKTNGWDVLECQPLQIQSRKKLQKSQPQGFITHTPFSSSHGQGMSQNSKIFAEYDRW